MERSEGISGSEGGTNYLASIIRWNIFRWLLYFMKTRKRDMADSRNELSSKGSTFISVLSALSIFLIIKPEAVTTLPWLDNSIDLGVVALFACYTWDILKRRKRVSLSFTLLAIYILYTLAVELIETPSVLLGEISSWLRAFLGFNLITDLLRHDYRSTIGGMANCASVMLLLDIVTGFWNYATGEDGLNILSFLGTDVYSIFTVVPLLAVVVVDAVMNGGAKRGRAVTLFVSCTVQKIVTGAATAGVSLVILGLLLLLVRYKPALARIAVKPFNSVSVLIGFTLVFAVFGATEAFAPFFESIGKDVTMNGRTIIWAAAVPEIMRDFIWGHGLLSSVDFIALMGFNPWEIYFGHCHNMVLEILFRGGLIGFLLFSAFIASVFIHGAETDANDCESPCKDSLVIVIQAFIFASCILWITDGYPALSAAYLMLALYKGVERSECTCSMRSGEPSPAVVQKERGAH